MSRGCQKLSLMMKLQPSEERNDREWPALSIIDNEDVVLTSVFIDVRNVGYYLGTGWTATNSDWTQAEVYVSSKRCERPKVVSDTSHR
jgi:hypothetical protein